MLETKKYISSTTEKGVSFLYCWQGWKSRILFILLSHDKNWKYSIIRCRVFSIICDTDYTPLFSQVVVQYFVQQQSTSRVIIMYISKELTTWPVFSSQQRNLSLHDRFLFSIIHSWKVFRPILSFPGSRILPWPVLSHIYPFLKDSETQQ